MPPETKALVNDEAAQVIRAANVVRNGLPGKLGGVLAPDVPDWDSALRAALSPDASFLMARDIVNALHASGPSTDEVVARAVGAVGAADTTFRQALLTAEDDGHVERDGGLLRLTALSDGDLEESSHVVQIEEAICATLEERGLAYREALAMEVGLPGFSSPEFQAALERAMFSGRVVWSSPRVYALPQARLHGFERPDGLLAAGPVDMKAALSDLATAVARLGKAMSAARAMAPSDGATPQLAVAPNGSSNGAVQQLRDLAELRDAGVISADDFESKKGELLKRM